MWVRREENRGAILHNAGASVRVCGRDGSYVTLCVIFASFPSLPTPPTLRAGAESRWLPLVLPQHCAWHLVRAQRSR